MGYVELVDLFMKKEKKRSMTNIFPKKTQNPPKNPLFPGAHYISSL